MYESTRFFSNPFDFPDFFNPFEIPNDQGQDSNGQTEKKKIGGGSGFIITEDA